MYDEQCHHHRQRAAGISAALYTARAGVETLVIGGGAGALAKADKIENYYGFAEPVAAKDLLAAGIAQAKHAGAEVLEDEVVGIGFGTKLTVSTRAGSMRPTMWCWPPAPPAPPRRFPACGSWRAMG